MQNEPAARTRARPITAVVLALVMVATSTAAYMIRPGSSNGREPAISLERDVPTQFAGWSAMPQQTSLVINPQTDAYVFGVYSQVISRTYVDASGYRVMLSVAYNEDQRGSLQTHRPEACYPAQGFAIGPTESASVNTAFGGLDVRQLSSTLGPRSEPITYWVTVGDRVVNDRIDKRLYELKLALRGQAPDGLLFRVSSIDPDPGRAYAAHRRFVADMMASVPPKIRQKLAGLAAPSPG